MLIGLIASFAFLMIAIIKSIEAVCFFQNFRKETEASLKRIEETLKKSNP